MDLEQLYRQYWKMISTQQSEVKWEMSFSIRPVLHIHRTPELLQQSIDDLQNRLIELKLLERRSGRFDNDTKAAVETFQHRNSLRVDGVVGPLTWAALFYPTLVFTKDAPTSHKAFVEKIQEILIEEGFEIQVNGHFNRETNRALRRFQRRYGLRPDGVCGPMTWTMLLGQRLVPVQPVWSSGILTRQAEQIVEQMLIIAAIWIGIVRNPLGIQEELSLLTALVVAYSLTIAGPLILEKFCPCLLVCQTQPLLRYAPYVLIGLLWRPILGVVLMLSSATLGK